MKIWMTVLALPFCATAAFAQTPPATPPADSSDASDSMTFGSDWTETLGAAVFSDDAHTTLRTADELRAQWSTLSTEDQDMLKRDCAALNAQTGASTGAMPGTGGVTVNSAQMAEICATVDSL